MDPVLILAIIAVSGGCCCCCRTDFGPGLGGFLGLLLLFVHPILGLGVLLVAFVMWLATRQPRIKIAQPIDPDSKMEIYKPAILSLLALVPLLFGVLVGLTR